MNGTEAYLWQVYTADRSPAARDALVEFYLPWVKQLAANMASKLPDSIDPLDLFQEGAIAMVLIIERFDVTRGLRFTTYALARIRGAMVDFLRGQDWVPRLERTREKAGQVECVKTCQLSTTIRSSNTDEQALESELGEQDPELLRSVLTEDVDHALRGLCRRNRFILLFYYLEDMTMKDIGQVLGLSESRVSRCHSAALEFLHHRELACA
jgi:RNA polymerase sigma factor for flagellar operon FliA